jgi:hypothetical protein
VGKRFHGMVDCWSTCGHLVIVLATIVWSRSNRYGTDSYVKMDEQHQTHGRTLGFSEGLGSVLDSSSV